MYLDPRNTSYGFRVESPNAHDSKFMIGFVPSAQHAENAEIAEAKMEAKHQDHPNFSMESKNSYKN